MRISVGQLVILLLLLIAIGGGIAFGAMKLTGKDLGIGKKSRQSVFLTNGQVYFGYITSENNHTVKMRDIYYLQVQQPLQPPKDKEAQQPQISLVKLGNELHGPKDEMRINREHVLFIEDMKDDSKVNQAIADFIKNGPPASPAPQQ